jgi:hypothetical protein
MTTKVEVFKPITEGINANFFLSEKKDGIRIALHSEKWNKIEKFFSETCPGVIKNFPATFNISLAYYEGCANIFILSINTMAETERISYKLPLQGLGRHTYRDFALASHHIATQFCQLNGMTIYTEMSHWPILQYVLEKK